MLSLLFNSRKYLMYMYILHERCYVSFFYESAKRIILPCVVDKNCYKLNALYSV